LTAGATFPIHGCGTAFQLMPSARLVIVKDHLVPPELHGIAGLGPLGMPVYAVGELGRGRVVVFHTVEHNRLAEHLSVSAERYFLDLLAWLAEPRRESPLWH